ncbi:MAG: hypothetical protein U0670_20100 [Anaerolineae bacterium]
MKSRFVFFGAVSALMLAAVLVGCSSASSTTTTAVPTLPDANASSDATLAPPVLSNGDEDSDEDGGGSESGAESGAVTISTETTASNTTASAECTRLNLNTVTGDQLTAAIPNFPNRMIREFLEYRPYDSILVFRQEIGKYVGETQVAEWEAYIYAPIDVNASDTETLKQIPGITDDLAATLIAGRPYADNAAFLTALGGSLTADQVAQASCLLVGAA